MNDIWVLSIKTSLPGTFEKPEDIKTEIFAFKSFDCAKGFLRDKLKELAFSKNSMFNGNGGITHFENYISSSWDPDKNEEVDEWILTKPVLLQIYDLIKSILDGKDNDISKIDDSYFDAMIDVEILEGTITLNGGFEGPCNGYDPLIFSNMSDMSEEKDYFLFITDLFAQDDSASVLFIDLKKADIR